MGKVLLMPNPISESASIFVDYYQKEGWPAAGQYYNTLKLPEQIKPQFKEEAQKEFNKRGMDIDVRI